MKKITLNGEEYSEEYLIKAVSFYQDLQDGTIADAIKKGLKK